MRKLLLPIILGIIVCATTAMAAAATAYEMYFVTFNPYSKTPVAGPFETLTECMMAKPPAPTTGYYTCDILVY